MIIGITGHLRNGKDEVAKVLAVHYGFIRWGFGDALRAEMKKRLPRTLQAIAFERGSSWSGYPSADDLLCSKPRIVRELMQEYGTEVRRADDPDYWLKRWMEGWVQVRAQRVAVPDVRFFNEADLVRSLGGKLIRVVRPGVDGGHAVTHASETEMDRIAVDATLLNDGTLDDLHQQVIATVRPWVED